MSDETLREPVAPDPAYRRLTTRPLPAYRFVDGLNPHPLNDPRGHSYEAPEPDLADEAARLRDDWRASPQFCYGVDLYNLAYWWEAHETWEPLWQCFKEGDPVRHALQAFIQLSAAHIKRHIGRRFGVTRLVVRARGHLDIARRGGPIVLGVELNRWWSEAVRPYFVAEADAPYPFLDPR